MQLPLTLAYYAIIIWSMAIIMLMSTPYYAAHVPYASPDDAILVGIMPMLAPMITPNYAMQLP